MNDSNSKLGDFVSLALLQPSVFRRTVIADRNPQSGRFKKRPIYAPDQDARRNHAAIIAYLATVAGPMPYAFGAVAKRSPLANVAAHRCHPSGRFPRYWFQTDISAAYGAIRPSRLAEAILARAPELAAAGDALGRVLWRHCFVWEPEGGGNDRQTCRGLYTGGPASPLLFNLYCDHWLDPALAALGLGYTRYLDDLTFSSHSPIGRRTRSRIMRAIRMAGFQPNVRKTELVDLTERALRVTGLVVHADGRVGLTKRYAGELRAMAHQVEKVLDASDRGELPLDLPKGVSGTFGVLVALARSRLPDAEWRGGRSLFDPPPGFTATEWSLLSRFLLIRRRIRALRDAKRLTTAA